MQISEGQFMAYIEKNSAALVGSFRLPQIYRGATEGHNRANAQVAIEMTEQQVFQPERDDFDALINRFFFYDLGIRYWRFRTKGPPPANLEERTKILIEAAKEGICTHNEGRQVLSAFFGRDLERIDSPWADLPNPVALEVARLNEEARLLPDSSGDAGKVSGSGGTNGKQGNQGRPRRKADSDSG
jgi:capsid portal protein